MKDELLTRFIRDEVSPAEEKEVLDWINETPENASYFIKLKNIFVFQNMPEETISYEAIDRIKGITSHKKRVFWPYMAAACFALLLFLNLFNYLPIPKKSESYVARIDSMPIDQKTIIYTEKGVKGKTELPDGSKVILNSDTKIIFPNHFTGATREVWISGEAYFEVKSDTLVPMVVNTNRGFRVEVHGTVFNIRSYENDTEAQVTLYSGKIILLERDSLLNIEKVVEMSPSQSIVIGKKTTPILVKTQNTESESAWKDGYLVFESLPLFEVIKRLERWHGIKIHVEDEKIMDVPVTANFQSESLIQIMELLKFSIKIEYQMIENEVFLK